MMMQLRAMVIDCFRDALDRKIFWVMAGISVFIVLLLALIDFDDTGVNLMFGLWHLDTPLLSRKNPELDSVIGAILTKYIGDFYIGWIGIILGLVATAGIFPSLMERGAIEAVLAKPISRSTVFLGRYLGAMVFVFVQVTIFVVLTFLVVGLRWEYWRPAYLWCIPLMVVLFSYVYAFSALFGVVTRSAMSALLLTMLAWIAIVIPQFAYETVLSLPALGIKVDQKWVTLSGAVKAVVPKTGDITYIAGNLIGAAVAPEMEEDLPPTTEPSLYSPDAQKLLEAEQRLSAVNLVKSIGSSLMFELVIVFIALRKFCKRDY